VLFPVYPRPTVCMSACPEWLDGYVLAPMYCCKRLSEDLTTDTACGEQPASALIRLSYSEKHLCGMSRVRESSLANVDGSCRKEIFSGHNGGPGGAMR
jgi:hypothetical protein